MPKQSGAFVAIGLCAIALPGIAGAGPEKPVGQWGGERIRCLAYLGVSDKTEEQVARVRQMGFNYVLANPGLCDSPVETLMPLVRAADKAGLRIIWVASMANQFSNPALREALAGDTRRFVGADGRVSPGSACPTDPVFWWAVWFNRALPLARLAAQGHKSSAGLLLDPEDYSGGFDETRYCHDDLCFYSFCESIGRTDAAAAVPAETRHAWLVDNGLWDRYCAFQDEQVAKMLPTSAAR